jgi:hypothetical protein
LLPPLKTNRRLGLVSHEMHGGYIYNGTGHWPWAETLYWSFTV